VKINLDNDFTIVARLSLFCDEGQVYRNLIQSIVPVGSIFGLIIANLFSAYYGNKKAMVFVQIVASISVMRIIYSYLSNSLGCSFPNSRSLSNFSIFIWFQRLFNDDHDLYLPI
jgi:hypothetical protein